jgi:hypothetical protein
MIIVLRAGAPEQGIVDEIDEREHEHGIKMLEDLDPSPEGWIAAIPTASTCGWSGDDAPCQKIANYVVAYSDRETKCMHVPVCEHHAHCLMGAVSAYHERKGMLTPEQIDAMYEEAKR